MLRYTLKRLLSLLISLAVASLVIFFVIEVAPGDPALFMLGMNAPPETIVALRTELGLDVSKFERYQQKIDRVEAEVEAYDMTSSKDLNSQFRELEKDENLEKELEELKKKVVNG